MVWVEGEKVPLMVQKTDGGFGYGTTDMAALRQRVQDERAEWLIYVVDEGQSGHFKRAPTQIAHVTERDRLLCRPQFCAWACHKITRQRAAGNPIRQAAWW